MTLEKISNFSFNLGIVFNFPKKLRQQIFECDDLVERILISYDQIQKMKKVENLNNMDIVFRI